jgi:transposase-like protein
VKAPPGGAHAPPDPEVPERPARRHFTAGYKLGVLRAADAATKPGDIAALLRREGLYSSHLVAWRRQRTAGALGALAAKKRGPKAEPVNPLARRNAELEREKRALERRLKQAELIIDFQKKVSELLGIPLKSPESDGSDS